MDKRRMCIVDNNLNILHGLRVLSHVAGSNKDVTRGAPDRDIRRVAVYYAAGSLITTHFPRDNDGQQATLRLFQSPGIKVLLRYVSPYYICSPSINVTEIFDTGHIKQKM